MGTMFCYLKGCPKCSGDLVFDEGDWRCWQCGQYYYPSSDVPKQDFRPGTLLEMSSNAHGKAVTHVAGLTCDGEQPEMPRSNSGFPRAARSINAVIRAKQTSDERWGDRNRQIIEYIDKGMSVREIAKLVDRGERQIRVVRERLAELRAAEGYLLRKQ